MSSQTATPNTEAAILARLIQMGQEELSRGAPNTCCQFALMIGIRRV